MPFLQTCMMVTKKRRAASAKTCFAWHFGARYFLRLSCDHRSFLEYVLLVMKHVLRSSLP